MQEHINMSVVDAVPWWMRCRDTRSSPMREHITRSDGCGSWSSPMRAGHAGCSLTLTAGLALHR